MASSVISVEWANQNSLRNYPFAEDCTLRPNDSTGHTIEDGWRVPNYLVTDIVVGVPGTDYDPTVYMKRLSVVGGSATLTFADADGNDIFTVSCTASDVSKQIAGVGTFSDATGVIRFGDLERFFTETPEGLYTFSQDASRIEPTCIRPSAIGVHSISVADSAGYTSAGLQGDIKLVAGENVNIRYYKESNAIVISADPNSGYTDGCDCDEGETKYVKSINGISTENVILAGDDCISIETADNGVITIVDKCSKPCCGCAETAFINQTINDLQSSVNTLSNNAATLSERITTFVNNYLLARKTLA